MTGRGHKSQQINACKRGYYTWCSSGQTGLTPEAIRFLSCAPGPISTKKIVWGFYIDWGFLMLVCQKGKAKGG